jgi:hypothetical protein
MPILCALPHLLTTGQFKYKVDCSHFLFFYFAGSRAFRLSLVSARAHFVYSASFSDNKSLQIQGSNRHPGDCVNLD